MKGKFKLNHLIVHLILLVGVIVVVFPFAWMILTSFKTSGEAMKIPPTIFPEKFVTTAYHTIVTSAIPFATVYMNTIITTVVTTLVQIVFCSMAGYAFGRIEFPFKNAIFILVLSVLMVPGQIFLLPQYQIVQKLGLLDTIPALFLPNLFSAFGTFLLRQFFMSLPKELFSPYSYSCAGSPPWFPRSILFVLPVADRLLPSADLLLFTNFFFHPAFDNKISVFFIVRKR